MSLREQLVAIYGSEEAADRWIAARGVCKPDREARELGVWARRQPAGVLPLLGSYERASQLVLEGAMV